MKTIKLPRKFKKACKKAVQNKFPLGNWKLSEIGICGISSESNYVNRKSSIVVGGKAITGHRMYPR